MNEVKRYGCDGNKIVEVAGKYGMVLGSDYDAAQSELAALREEMATLQRKHERTESALNGSMKALTRVDNMWKKRWLDKTGEASTALIVDDEFKAVFEEIKDYRWRLTAAEQRNSELVGLLLSSKDILREIWDKSYNYEASDALAALALVDDIDATLNHTESGAN